MSCVVGIKHEGRVYIGGDSRTSGDSSRTLTPENSKVYRCGPLLIGHTGSMRTAQIIRYVLKLEDYDSALDVFEYLVTKFALPLREALKEHGATFEDKDDSEGPAGDVSSTWLVIGFNGRLFEMDGNFTIHEYVDDFTAKGSGMMLALGSLHATSSTPSPEKRITIALEAAARFDASGVGPPFIIESIEDESANALILKAWQHTYDAHRKNCKKRDHSKCRP